MHDPLQHESYIRLQAAISRERELAANVRQTLIDQMAQLHAALNGLTAQLEESITGGENTAAEMGEALQAFREMIAAELQAGAGARERIETLETALAEKTQALEEAEQRRAEIERDRVDSQTACAAARDRAASLDEQVMNLSRLIDTHKERGERLQEEVKERAETEENLRRELEALQSRMAEADAGRHAQEETEAALLEARQEVERLRALADTLGPRLSEESAAKSAVEAELEELREESAVKQAALETEILAARAETAALRAQLEESGNAAEALAKAREEQQAMQASLDEARLAMNEMEVLQKNLRAERERSAVLEERLNQELAKGNRTALAAQLAEAVKEAEEAQNTIAELRREMEAMSKQAPKSAPQNDAGRVLAVARRKNPHKRSIGEILVDAGILGMDQLEQALEEQRGNPNRHLGGILIEMGLTSEDAVAQALACQCGAEFIRLDEAAIEADAPAAISERLANQHACIPIRVSQDTVVLAMANPMDLVAIEDVERAANKRVEVVVATAAEVRAAIAKHYEEVA